MVNYGLYAICYVLPILVHEFGHYYIAKKNDINFK